MHLVSMAIRWYQFIWIYLSCHGRGVSANNAPCIIPGYLSLAPNEQRILPWPMNLSRLRNLSNPLFLLHSQLHSSSCAILLQPLGTRRPWYRNNLNQSPPLKNLSTMPTGTSLQVLTFNMAEPANLPWPNHKVGRRSVAWRAFSIRLFQ